MSSKMFLFHTYNSYTVSYFLRKQAFPKNTVVQALYSTRKSINTQANYTIIYFTSPYFK